MSKDCRPIGFFDSGIGGISVLKTAYSLMPNENYIYFGDNKNAPYGNKTEDMIKALSMAAGDYLFSKGVKAIVMACNTATSAAVLLMREKFNIPVISMEPAVKPAMASVRGGKVLVLATPATVSQPRYLGLLERLGAGSDVISVGCGGLVELIEQNRADERSVHEYMADKLADIQSENIDAVVLGCTHYAFVEPYIKSFFYSRYSKDCRIFDGRFGTAKHLKSILEASDMTCKDNSAGRIEFLSSGQAYEIERFKTLFTSFDNAHINA